MVAVVLVLVDWGGVHRGGGLGWGRQECIAWVWVVALCGGDESAERGHGQQQAARIARTQMPEDACYRDARSRHETRFPHAHTQTH